jgi:hypothetical protein
MEYLYSALKRRNGVEGAQTPRLRGPASKAAKNTRKANLLANPLSLFCWG